jgi:nicotinic acid mononucleotide adenylyltransferase
MKIGLIAMSGKPVTAGHWSLIETAAKENDLVKVYVSLSDRKRPGELTILGSDMEAIWKRYLQPILPKNVMVTYGGSPVRKIYEFLQESDEKGSDNIFQIYGDPTDISQNFPTKNMLRYVENLWKNDQIILRKVSREGGIDISGTKMREFLSNGLKMESIKQGKK